MLHYRYTQGLHAISYRVSSHAHAPTAFFHHDLATQRRTIIRTTYLLRPLQILVRQQLQSNRDTIEGLKHAAAVQLNVQQFGG